MKGFGHARQRTGGTILLLRLVFLLVVSVAFQWIEPVYGAGIQPTNLTHKIEVRDQSLAKQIEAAGGTLIGDYGSYRLYEVLQSSSNWSGNPKIEIRDGYNSIRLNTGHLDTRKAEVRMLRKSVGEFSGKHLHLIQFAGPVQPQWRDELLTTGVKIIDYIPENTYLVYGDSTSLAKVQAIAATASNVQWEAAFADDYKIHPRARNVTPKGKPRAIGTDLFSIQLIADDAENSITLALLDKLKLEPFKRKSRVMNFVFVIARLDANQLKTIASQPDVISISPYFQPTEFCERQDQIIAGNLSGGIPNGPGYLAWLLGLGFTQSQFTTSGFIVDIGDSGIDNGTTTPAHFGLYVGGNATNASRVIYNRFESTTNYSQNSLAGCDGHGNINAHIVAGYDDFSGFPFADGSGYHYGLGVCPFVNVGSSVIFDSVDGNNFYFPNYNNMESEAYENGARIGSYSWGEHGSQGVYDSEALNFDSLVRDAQPTNSTYSVSNNQEMVIVFAGGNDGSGSMTIDSPGTAKNVLTVGAGDNVQPFGAPDRSNIGDDEATNAENVANFSSRGPTADGRFKPDLLAPGTHVSGGVPQQTNDIVDFPDGDANSCYSGDDVSGGPNSLFWPTSGQAFYTASSGTSQATPSVAGGCALVRQWFINNYTNPPSPAMTKAYLMNSARYMVGLSANDTLPSPNQGMGEMNLGMAFDGTPRIVYDESPQNTFTASGQIRVMTGQITDTNKPFRVTLAWTDAPGSLSGDSYNNNLDLVVIAGGNTYKGNVFSGAYSVPGGNADAVNNVESVFLPAGTSGTFTISVLATSINSVGVFNSSNAICQDFALVAYNATNLSPPVALSSGYALVGESCMPSNGVINPGETVTVDFSLQNVGTQNFSNLVATLQTNSGVTNVSAPQSYGELSTNGIPVAMPFTFKALGTCGGSITATLQLQDGSLDYGTISLQLPLGKLVSTQLFLQNFDGVVAPLLPTGWATSSTNAATNWITTTNEFDTAPNAVFASDPPLPGLAELDSPIIPITSASAQLSFKNWYDLEAYPSESASPQQAYDGGVLEISIDGAAYQDILAAGGSFVTNGYTAPIPAQDDNPLDGRSVWSGNSGGFIKTIVNLPAAAAGHNIQLRWLCGTDSGNSDGGTGWYIDSIAITDGYYDCCNPLIPVTILNPQIYGTNVTFSFQTVASQTYSVQYKTSLDASGWMLLQSVNGTGSIVTITNSLTPPQRFYRVMSP